MGPESAHRPGRTSHPFHAASGDSVLPEAQQLAKHGKEYGVNTKIMVYPVPTDVFHVFRTFLPEATGALDDIGRYIRSLTGTPADPAANHGSRSSRT